MLCGCLTADQLSDIPELSQWTVTKGRLGCFDELYKLYQLSLAGDDAKLASYEMSRLSDYFCRNSDPSSSSSNLDTHANVGLNAMLAMALQWQYQTRATSASDGKEQLIIPCIYDRSMNIILPSGISSGLSPDNVPQLLVRSHILTQNGLSTKGMQAYPAGCRLSNNARTPVQPRPETKVVNSVESKPPHSQAKSVPSTVRTSTATSILKPTLSIQPIPETLPQPPTRSPAHGKVSATAKDGELDLERVQQQWQDREQFLAQYRVSQGASPGIRPSTPSSAANKAKDNIASTLGAKDTTLSRNHDLSQPTQKDIVSSVDPKPSKPSDVASSSSQHRTSTDQPLSQSCRPQTLLEVNCPLRCIAIIPPSFPINTRDGALIAIIGSNAKSLHMLSIPSSLSTSPTPTHQEHENIHRGSIYCIDYRDNLIATGSNDKSLQLTPCINRSKELDITQTVVLKGHTGTIRAVKFHPSTYSNYIASAGGGDFQTRLWDMGKGMPNLHCIPIPYISILTAM